MSKGVELESAGVLGMFRRRSDVSDNCPTTSRAFNDAVWRSVKKTLLSETFRTREDYGTVRYRAVGWNIRLFLASEVG